MIADDLLLGAAVSLLLTGGLTATFSSSPLKRVAGVAIAMMGAVSALAALRVDQSAMVAGAAVTFALVALGGAIVVRLQESYGAGDADSYDAADRDTEPAEPEP